MNRTSICLHFVLLPVLLCLLVYGCMRKRWPPVGSNEFRLGNTRIPVRVQQFGAPNAVAYLLLHYNETAAAKAADEFLNRGESGLLLQLISNKGRNIGFSLDGKNFEIDPNRIFTDAGVRNEVGNHLGAQKLVTDFARFILSHTQGSKLMVALHNNTDGGTLSLNEYLAGGSFEKEAAAVCQVPGQDVDDFVLTTDAQIFKRCKAAGFNTVLQDNRGARDDGSASIYCGRNNIPYMNIEAEEHDRRRYTQKVLQALVATGP